MQHAQDRYCLCVNGEKSKMALRNQHADIRIGFKLKMMRPRFALGKSLQTGNVGQDISRNSVGGLLADFAKQIIVNGINVLMARGVRTTE